MADSDMLLKRSRQLLSISGCQADESSGIYTDKTNAGLTYAVTVCRITGRSIERMIAIDVFASSRDRDYWIYVQRHPGAAIHDAGFDRLGEAFRLAQEHGWVLTGPDFTLGDFALKSPHDLPDNPDRALWARRFGL